MGSSWKSWEDMWGTSRLVSQWLDLAWLSLGLLFLSWRFVSSVSPSFSLPRPWLPEETQEQLRSKPQTQRLWAGPQREMRQPLFKQLIACMGGASQTPGPARFPAIPIAHLPPGVWAGAVLALQCIRIRLPMREIPVWSMVREDATCCTATKPTRHNCWACVLQLLKLTRLGPVLRN